MKLNEIYTAQSYLDEVLIAEKQENKDYVITVELIPDDDKMIPMLVDGNHSLEAARRDGVEPEIKIGERNHKDVESYVIAMRDLSNPVNIVTGEELW